jgi:hypothetical protein
MIRRIETAVAEAGVRGAVVVADAGAAVGAIVATLRAYDVAFALLVVDAPVPALERALLLAAIEPLAVELAPRTRVGAIDVAPGALLTDVAAAAAFLAGAEATTGQVLKIERQPPPS